MEKIMTLTAQSISQLCNGHPIAICWAGFYGKACSAILQYHGISVSYYLAKESGVTQFCGLPVYDLDHLPCPPKETKLIVAMDPYQMPQQIQKIKASAPFEQVIILEEQDIIRYCLRYEMELFCNRGIEISDDIWDFGFVKLHNPMLECPAYQKAFALQAKDLILPELGDTNLMTEGPYTFGPVSPKNGDVVLDCGANIGIFSAYAAAKGCQVFAFEPHSQTGTHFRLNQALYPEQIHLIAKAVGSRCGHVQLNVYDQDWGANSIVLQLEAPNVWAEDVEIITADEFVSQYGLTSVDFIKADIEGAERELLLGAQQLMKRDAPQLAICAYHLPDDVSVLSKLIRQGNPNYHIQPSAEKLFAWTT